MPVDWDHVCILGWYGRDGRAHLTSWEGDLPIIDVVVTGTGPCVPCGSAPVPPGAGVHPVPAGKDPKELALELGGLHAIGWIIEKGVRRVTAAPLAAAGGPDAPQERTTQERPGRMQAVQAVEGERLEGRNRQPDLAGEKGQGRRGRAD